MPGPKLLHESGSFARESASGRRKAVLITPGLGSSGSYSEVMLAAHAAAAFPAGTKLWFNHPKDGDPGARDPRDQWGYLPEAATHEQGVGIVGYPEVLPHAKALVESLGTQAALSIWAMGEADEAGNITALLAHETNSVDIVAYPGRPGSGMTDQMLESFRQQAENPGANPAPANQKKEQMDEKEMRALVKSELAEALAPVLAFVTQTAEALKAAAKAEAQVEADSAAVTAALESYDEKVAAIAAESFPEEVAKSLRESALKGEDIATEITKIKTLGEAFKAQAENDEQGGVVYGGRVSESISTEQLIPAGW